MHYLEYSVVIQMTVYLFVKQYKHNLENAAFCASASTGHVSLNRQIFQFIINWCRCIETKLCITQGLFLSYISSQEINPGIKPLQTHKYDTLYVSASRGKGWVYETAKHHWKLSYVPHDDFHRLLEFSKQLLTRPFHYIFAL